MGDSLPSLPVGVGSGFQLQVLGVPPSGTRSRVETQIKLCIQLCLPNVNLPLSIHSFGVSKVLTHPLRALFSSLPG